MYQSFARSLSVSLLGLSSAWLVACRPPHAAGVAPVDLPAPDSTLIELVSQDALRLRMDEPGYVLVFAVNDAGGWYLSHPAPLKQAAYLASSTATVSLWRSRSYGSFSTDDHLVSWASDQMCGAQPKFCSPPMAQALNSPSGLSGGYEPEPEYSYVVIITPVKPDSDQLTRRLHSMESPRPALLIPRWLVTQTASLIPVHRWAEF